VKATLRIAFSAFSLVPLQRWLNVVGGAMVVIGTLVALTAPNPQVSIGATAVLSLIGTFFIVMAPLFFGGFALRYASTRSLLHLRPHGRARMLAGATLAITLIAGLVTLPILVEYLYLAWHGGTAQLARLPGGLKPTSWFMAAWAFTATAWLALFIVSASRLLMMMTPALVVAIPVLLRARAPGSLQAPVALGCTLAAWALFAIWYLRAQRVRAPGWLADRSPLGFGESTIGPVAPLSPTADGPSPQIAQRLYLLGSTSLLGSALAGLIPALIILVLMKILMKRDAGQEMPAHFLFALCFIGGSIGFMVTRRARHLWLRTGLPRIALFHQVERLALPTSLLTFGTGATLLLGVSLWGRPELAPQLLLYAAAGVALSTSLFYLGCSWTRGWNAEDILATLGLNVLVMVVLVMIDPEHDAPLARIGIGAGVFVLLTLLLRWHARRRWRVLDWRVTRLPQRAGFR
jgi:hypothetical protein